MKRIASLAFAMALLAPLAPLHAYDKGGNPGKGKSHKNKNKGKDYYFRPDDVVFIRDYYARSRPNLPPGLQKKLMRTGQLPPGWEKRFQPFPVDVDHRLLPPCAYCERGYLDGYAVVYDKRTRIILDVVNLIQDLQR